MLGGIEVQVQRLRALTTVTLKLFLFPICREYIYIYGPPAASIYVP